jgi:hypothetical protein
MAKILDPYHLLRKNITHPIAGIDDDWVNFFQTFDLDGRGKGPYEFEGFNSNQLTNRGGYHGTSRICNTR